MHHQEKTSQNKNQRDFTLNSTNTQISLSQDQTTQPGNVDIMIKIPESGYISLHDYLTERGIHHVEKIVLCSEASGNDILKVSLNGDTDILFQKVDKKMKTNDGRAREIGDKDFVNGLYQEIDYLRTELTKQASKVEKLENTPTTVKQEVKKAPKKSRYWSPEEHERFLEALEIYGRKDVKSIAAFVKTRSPTQVRTHAQKWFLKLKREEERISEQREKEKMALEDQIHKEWLRIQTNVSPGYMIPLTAPPFGLKAENSYVNPYDNMQATSPGYSSPQSHSPTPTPNTPSNDHDQGYYQYQSPPPQQTHVPQSVKPGFQPFDNIAPSYYHQDLHENIIYNQLVDSTSLYALSETLPKQYQDNYDLYEKQPKKRKASRTLSEVLGKPVSISPDFLPTTLSFSGNFL